MKKALVFTDIDGTIIDACYQPKALDEIKRLKDLNIPIILCSSKTRAEIEFYRILFNLNQYPFISENGGAIFCPKGYFQASNLYTKCIDGYDVIELGIAYREIREKLGKIRKKVAFSLTGFGDLSVKQLAQRTHLPHKLAEFSKKREYSEPIFANKKCLKTISKLAFEQKLNAIASKKYISLVGQHDKGMAAAILKNLYQSNGQSMDVYAIGNDTNDIPLLKVSKNPFYIKESSGLTATWASLVNKIIAK
jgi:mannosyl-3-phosphoglycerate phosphatase